MKMRAWYYYGPRDLRLEECELPPLAQGEALVRIDVATTCGTDLKIYRRGAHGLGPRVPFGHEYSGTVVEVGPEVTQVKPGDRVVSNMGTQCGHCEFCLAGLHSQCRNAIHGGYGTFAEYLIIPPPILQRATFVLPAAMDSRTAALTEPFACAVHGIDHTGIQLGDTVAINGAGPIGLMFTRLAKLRGAWVIVADLNPARLQTARRLGADETVQLGEGVDQVQAIRDLTRGGYGVDVAIEAVGLPDVWEKTVLMTRPGGTAVLFGGCAPGTSFTLPTNPIHYSEITIKGVFNFHPDLFRRSFVLLSQGVLDHNLFVTDTMPLGEVDKAFERLASGYPGIKIAIVPEG